MEQLSNLLSDTVGLIKSVPSGVKRLYNTLQAKVEKSEATNRRGRRRRLENLTQVNNGTGEITEECTQFSIPVESLYFIMLTGRGILELLKMRKQSIAVSVFLYLAADAEFDFNYCRLTPGIRKSIADSLQISVDTLNNALCTLGKHNFIKNDDGCILINPIYSYRGKLQDRTKAVKEWCKRAA